MRVNVYAEEMTDRLEIISKEIDGHTFTGLRFYLELPASTWKYAVGQPVDPSDPAAQDPRTHKDEVLQIRGPFVHRPGDDDSSAVTFWGKRDLRKVLRQALAMLDDHYLTRRWRRADDVPPGAAEMRAVRERIEDARGKVMPGNGYDYHSGEEYGLRRAVGILDAALAAGAAPEEGRSP